MASTTTSAPIDTSSDIGALWKEALQNYTLETKINLENYDQKAWTVSQITVDQQNQLQVFKGLRHDQSRLDKARSLIQKNASYIEQAAKIISDAASTAFPISGVVLTAFTCVMNAAKSVSANYDEIETFFTTMNSFLLRLSLLEGKLPKEKVFQKLLMNVFCALLSLCGRVQSYTEHWGRFKQWAKALVEGSDSKLKGAYDGLTSKIVELEKAVMMKTLSAAVETTEGVKTLQATSGQILTVTQETYTMTRDIQADVQQTVLLGMENAERTQEMLTGFHRLELISQEIQRQKAAEAAGPDSGAGKPGAVAVLTSSFTDPDMVTKVRMRELERPYVKGTFDWVETHESYRSLIDRKAGIVRITGLDGMGKSTFCYSLLRRLQANFQGDQGASAACFFFDCEHRCRNVDDMVRALCQQIAEQDQGYRDKVFAIVHSPQDKSASLWTTLFEANFSKDSGRRAVLLLDSVHMLDEESWTTLCDLMADAVDKNLAIQFVLTSTPAFQIDLAGVKLKDIDLVKNLIYNDIQLVAWALLHGDLFPSLAKLRSNTRARVVERASASADSFLYVQPALQRLNGFVGRTKIFKELGSLPKTTTGIYSLLLQDCLKRRTPEEIQQIRTLFIWLAHVRDKEGASIRVVQGLIDATAKARGVPTDNAIIVEEEIGGRLSSFLQLRSSALEDDGKDDAKPRGPKTKTPGTATDDDDDPTEEDDIDQDYILSFRESLLRDYVLETDEAAGWVCTPSTARLEMFRMMVENLKTESPVSYYARTFWFQHLREIDIEGTTTEDALEIAESIFSLISNRSSGLFTYNNFNNPSRDVDNSWTGMFPNTKFDTGLSVLSQWAKRAREHDRYPDCVPTATSEWIEEAARDPASTLVRLAKCFVENWVAGNFKLTITDAAGGPSDATEYAFLWAFKMLQMAKERGVSEVCQNEVLQKLLADEAGQSLGDDELYQLAVFASPDTKPSADLYLRIAAALFAHSNTDKAIETAKKALKMTADAQVELNLQLSLVKYLASAARDPTRTSRNPDERQALLEEALGVTSAAYSRNFERLKSESQDESLKQSVAQMCLQKAYAEALLGRLKDSIASLQLAVDVCPNVYVVASPFLTIYGDAEAYGCVMETLKVLRKPKTWASRQSSKLTLVLAPDSLIQRAAKETGDMETLVEMYDAAIEFSKNEPWDTWDPYQLREKKTIFCQTVMQDYERAKGPIYDMMVIRPGQTTDMTECSSTLSAILLEQFRLSTDLSERTIRLGEMQRLREIVYAQSGDSFEPYKSRMIIPYALMLKVSASAAEFQAATDTVFHGCMAMLADDRLANDFSSFRMLAKVLSVIPGLEAEAQTAFSCQFYVVNMNVFRARTAATATADESNPVLDDQPPPEADVKTVEGQYDLADVSLSGYACDDCGKEAQNWDDGSFYLCYYCTNTDLCQDCYTKRAEIEQGKRSPDWRVVCPAGHKHIKGPIKGWQGVRDGKLYLGDSPPLEFAAWLKDLKENRWPAAWQRYWQSGL